MRLLGLADNAQKLQRDVPTVEVALAMFRHMSGTAFIVWASAGPDMYGSVS